MNSSTKIQMQEFYLNYDHDNKYERKYGYINPIAAAYWRIRDEMVMESVLSRFDTLSKPLRVLEVGGGHGHELAKFASLGIPQSHLTSIDLVFHRVKQAKSNYPCMGFSQQDAAHLAFPDKTFDIVCQFLCVVQALSRELQQSICRDLVRVLKPGGIIIWFDITPLRWNLVLFLRLCNFLFVNRSPKQVVYNIKQSMCEALVPSRRTKAISEAPSSYLLPIAGRDVIEMFPGLKVHAVSAGLEFGCWSHIWHRNRIFAQALWRTGWFSDHCFAIIEKPDSSTA